MGSEGSKSCGNPSECSESSVGTSISSRGVRADNDVARVLCKGIRFTHCAIWARALGNKGSHEAMRIPVEILTVGLAAIARKTAGNSDHWAFVAKAAPSDPSMETLYFIAQFGSGVLIPSFEEIQSGKRDVHFTGYVSTRLEDATAIMCDTDTNRRVWIQKPTTKRWQYPHDGGKPLQEVSDCDNHWSEIIRPCTLEELKKLIYMTKCSKKSYSVLENNCQHFAEDMYNLCNSQPEQVETTRI